LGLIQYCFLKGFCIQWFYTQTSCKLINNKSLFVQTLVTSAYLVAIAFLIVISIVIELVLFIITVQIAVCLVAMAAEII
jgi:hypothetical protein